MCTSTATARPPRIRRKPAVVDPVARPAWSRAWLRRRRSVPFLGRRRRWREVSMNAQLGTRDVTLGYDRIRRCTTSTAGRLSARSAGDVGPNGAGQSTLFRGLVGILNPFSSWMHNPSSVQLQRISPSVHRQQMWIPGSWMFSESLKLIDRVWHRNPVGGMGKGARNRCQASQSGLGQLKPFPWALLQPAVAFGILSQGCCCPKHQLMVSSTATFNTQWTSLSQDLLGLIATLACQGRQYGSPATALNIS